MREEHPLQQELPDLPPGGPASAQVVEMSEVAALQAQVLDLGLVRESRPVFVYDSKLAKDKKGNAERQARHRERLEQKGLTMAQVPREVLELVKNTHGGDWSRLTQAPAPLEPQQGTSGIGGDVVIPKDQQEAIQAAGGLDAWVQHQVDAALASRPPVEVIKEVIQKVEVIKEVGRPVVKLTAEQRRVYEVGQKADKLTGWRASVFAWLLR